jgi:phage shock protein E
MKTDIIGCSLAIAVAVTFSITAPAMKAQTTGAKPTADSGSGQIVKNVDANEAEKLLKENKKVIVLDVRTPEEYKEGHIAGATNIDFKGPDFERKLATLDKKQPYLVHCAGGGRSAKARDLMKKLQFDSIYHLDGGLNAWQKAKKPVEK